MNPKQKLKFSNSYTQLPDQFYSRQLPEPVTSPGLIRVNSQLAEYLGIDPTWLESEQGLEFIAGNYIPQGADPVATVYAGHQFGGWSPQLGDGRAVLMGEVIAEDGIRYDIQLKGSGRTPYSRGGDGRSPVGPVLREYVLCEAMAVLGVPTSRALGAVTTGEKVMRSGRIPGAVFARVAQSHIRIGTFQYFAAQRDYASVKALTDHVIQRHYPQAAQADNPVLALLDAVVARQASLIAKWQCLGFIHGVMNTDNVLLSGETIDYGPCAFMDEFDPAKVFSSIDQGGRYAYRNQPHIAHWNLGMLAQALLPLLDDDQANALALGQAAIDVFPELYQSAYQSTMLKKLGLSGSTEEDEALIKELLTLMHEQQTDFTLTFRRLADLVDPDNASGGGVGSLIELPAAFEPWLQRWQQRLAEDPQNSSTRQAGMYAANPVFIPRNHLLEEAIEIATLEEDFEPFHRLVDVLARPNEYDPALSRYALPPGPGQQVMQTFCGT